MGSTLCFKKEVFYKIKFKDISIREDYYFNDECRIKIKKYDMVWNNSNRHFEPLL